MSGKRYTEDRGRQAGDNARPPGHGGGEALLGVSSHSPYQTSVMRYIAPAEQQKADDRKQR